MLLITNEDIKRAYAAYNLLDPEQQKAACEIAQKFPCTTEYVAKVLIKKASIGRKQKNISCGSLY